MKVEYIITFRRTSCLQAVTMVEDMGTGLLEDSHTKSGIPIEHLDYRYVEGCKNAKELEKILKVLR